MTTPSHKLYGDELLSRIRSELASSNIARRSFGVREMSHRLGLSVFRDGSVRSVLEKLVANDELVRIRQGRLVFYSLPPEDAE